jgi:hypothetical protein
MAVGVTERLWEVSDLVAIAGSRRAGVRKSGVSRKYLPDGRRFRAQYRGFEPVFGASYGHDKGSVHCLSLPIYNQGSELPFLDRVDSNTDDERRARNCPNANDIATLIDCDSERKYRIGNF